MVNPKILIKKLLLLLALILMTANVAHAESAFVFKNNLRLGSVGQDVKELQKYLNNNHFFVSESGIGSSGQETRYFGASTQAALIKFQKANNIIPALGYFGPATRSFINKLANSSGLNQSEMSQAASGVSKVVATPKTNIVNNAVGEPTAGDYTVSGVITGLVGPVTLSNNDEKIIINPNQNSFFTFSKKLINGAKYDVAVESNYTKQKCYTHDNSGVINSANVVDVKVACGEHLDYNPFTFIPSSGSQTASSVNNNAVLEVSFNPGASRLPLFFQRQGVSDAAGTPITLASSPETGANIYYTLDGSAPSYSSSRYSSPLKINSDTTIKATAEKSGYSSFSTVSASYKINKSKQGLFSNPHGTVRVGDKFFIGARTNPATVTVFNNPNDLSDYQTVTLTGHSNLDYLIYDSVNDRLYASCYDGEAYAAPHKMTIISINPNNLNSWSVVYNNAALWSDWAAPIVTDGAYLYGVSYNDNPAQFFKIRISDWQLVAQRSWTGVYYPHSSALVSYSGRKEMYVSTVWDSPTKFAKVNLSDLTFSSVSLGTSDPITDDIACRYMDDTGSICYLGTDDGAAGKKGYAVDTRTMAVSNFSLGAANSYGMFIKDNNLYSLGTNNTITRFTNFNTAAPEVFTTPGIIPNEMLYSSSGKMYVTDWSSSSSLMEFNLAE